MQVQVIGALNNKPEEVAGWLTRARGICDAEYGPDNAPEAVFIQVLGLLASKTMVTTQQNPTPVDPAMFDPRLSGRLGR